MKKLLIILISISIFTLNISLTNAFSLPQVTFDNYAVKNQYIKFENLIEAKLGTIIANFSTENKSSLNTRLNTLKDLFIKLDRQVTLRNRKEGSYIITDLKKEIVSMIYFVKNAKNIQKINTTNNSIVNKNQVKLNEFASNSVYGDLMYYADYFEGRNTSNGNIFSQAYFSAAKCNVDLNKFIQVWSGNKSLIVKVNDRPNCERFPNLIDMTTTAFDYFSARYIGKAEGEYIELGTSLKDYYKMYFPTDIYNDEGIVLQNKTPNSYLLNETININGELTLPGREISLKIISPTGKNIVLTKQVDKYFSFSYPLEELGEYSVSFVGSSNTFKIYTLDDSLFSGKKFITQDITKISSPTITKEPLGKELNAYRIVLKGNNYNVAVITIGGKTYYYSGIGDIIIPENILNNTNEVNIRINSSKTITNFSHDFYTEPVAIFDGNVIMSK
ncbi:MAG: hypothetical protein PHZ26_05740 [Candidatus Gracilibacteria bacterium]|nr:hypothetical protein [Candidatus Gracilibacteria bacterium]MDD2909217.1 hypothetical protein [Candidatus Gracilibacteria bacterium]